MAHLSGASIRGLSREPACSAILSDADDRDWAIAILICGAVATGSSRATVPVVAVSEGRGVEARSGQLVNAEKAIVCRRPVLLYCGVLEFTQHRCCDHAGYISSPTQ
jgi:hypothetical protein